MFSCFVHKRVMKKENKRKKLIVVVLAVILGLGFIGLLSFAIYDAIASKKSIVRLGDYSALTYTATDRDTAGTQVVDLIVGRTRFGGVVEKDSETLYQSSMSNYQKDADYLEMSIERYVEIFFGSELSDFQKTVKKESLQVAKEEAVLNAIADKEKIILSDADYEKLLTSYMESVGYTDRDKFLAEYSESSLRERMRLDITVDYLLGRASGPALND